MRKSSRRVPVFEKNLMKTPSCVRNTVAVINMMIIVSTARSMTTVPRALEKTTPSCLFSIPQRANSPIRGMTRLAAYDMKMAYMLVDVRGCSPTGFKICFQRHPRNTWARIPNGRESSIHVQFISWRSTCLTLLKSNPRYIQYKMTPPRIRGSAIFNVLLIACFASIAKAKITKMVETTAFF